ncbi:hypothetical protein FRC04_003758 [Tulasnella sp. 424]|nr:hypothetical protein FRC04_003758 [Tulasnella sp. 424]
MSQNQGLGGTWMTDLLGALPNPGAPMATSAPGPQPPNHTPNPGPQPRALSTQQIDVTTLLGLIAALNAGNAMTGAAARTAKTGRVKIREPEVYDGKKRGRAVVRFILNCELYFTARRNNFNQEADQIRFTISYLTDTARAWVEPILIDNLDNQNDPESYNWDTFKTALEGAFGDTDREGTAIHELEALKQGKRPVSTYALDFQKIKANISNWDESTFVHYYHKGLSEDIKDYLN